MTPKYILFNNRLKRGILLLITFLLIAFNSFSQTTDTGFVKIPRIQAIKIIKALQNYNDLKQIDSLHQANIVYYQSQLSLKDTTISLIDLKVQYLQHINDDLNKSGTLQQDITKQYIKQNRLLKLQRDGIVVVAIGVLVKVFLIK